MPQGSIMQLLKVGSLIVFPIFIIFFLIISAILNYHWKKYGVTVEKIKEAKQLYYGISLILLFASTMSFIIILFN